MDYCYKVGDICIFTNRGVSGVTSNDGKRCRITLQKPREWWAQGEPEYGIEFLDDHSRGTGHGFGCRESELELDFGRYNQTQKEKR